MPRLAIFAAAIAALSCVGIATVINARAEYEATEPSVSATIQRACMKTCPDCPPFCAETIEAAYVPPQE